VKDIDVAESKHSDLASSGQNWSGPSGRFEGYLTGPRHSRVGEAAAAELKALQLGLIMAKSERLLRPSR